ncbi:hypothetical protein I552_8020 [Mycobacterium xenopi 3993]|nr:hypothetical protein I552_8020 [Mycobacterium xenopi 3993]
MAEHLGVTAPVRADWLLLVELASDHDQTQRLADALDGLQTCGEPAVGVDTAAQQRLWRCGNRCPRCSVCTGRR